MQCRYRQNYSPYQVTRLPIYFTHISLIMAYQLSNTRGMLLQRLISDQENINRRARIAGEHAYSLFNKENVFSVQKRKKPSSRILRLQFPISKPKREVFAQKSPTGVTAAPLVQTTTLNLQKEIASIEIECPSHKPNVMTERPKAWRMRKHHFQQPSEAVLAHARKRTLGDRELTKPGTTGQDPLFRSKKLIDNMIRDKIEGWEQSSSNSSVSVEDCIILKR